MRTIVIALSTVALAIVALAQIGGGLVFPGPGSGTFGLPPVDTTSLMAWYSADCITYTSSVCSTPANGSTLTTWADHSGNGNTATVATGTCTFNSNQIDGRPAVTFSSCGLTLASGIGTAVGAYTAFAVLKRSDTTTKGDLFACVGSNTQCFKYHSADTSTTHREQGVDASDVALIGDGTAVADANWHQMNVIATSGTGVGHSIAFRLDRASDGSPAAGTANFVGNVGSIGYEPRSVIEFFPGQISELMIYNVAKGSVSTNETYNQVKYPSLP